MNNFYSLLFYILFLWKLPRLQEEISVTFGDARELHEIGLVPGSIAKVGNAPRRFRLGVLTIKKAQGLQP